MAKARTIAITGASGFLGRNTVAAALQAGLGVVGVVRHAEAAAALVAAGARAAVFPSMSAADLTSALAGISAVIHLAGIARGSPEDFKRVNVDGTRALLDAAAKVGLERAVLVSGLGCDQALRAPWGKNHYFRSKARVEELAVKSAVPCVVFRPSYILGPGDELIPSLVRSLRSGRVAVAGQGDVPMQPIFVGDAAHAFVAAASGRGPGRAIHDLVGPETVDMRRLIDLVAWELRRAGEPLSEWRIEPLPPERAGEELGLTQDELDVMSCDALGNPRAMPEALGISLSPLAGAVRAAVNAELGK